jgi:hypothetical protein
MDANSFFNIGNLIAGILTIGIVSFLYKDNPLYKFCEALFVGISAGYWLVIIIFTVILPKLYDKLVSQEYVYLVGGAFGVLMLLRLVPKISWLSNWALAFVVGSTAGVNLIGYMQSNGMNQVKNTILPLWTGSWGTSIGNIIIVVGTFCGLVYFFFSKEHKGAFGGLAKVGILFLMVTFGAAFGYTVMSRMSLLIGRMDFIFGTWMGLVR